MGKNARDPELILAPEWLWRWFHGRSRLVQWALALPVIVWLLYEYSGTKRVREPGEPAQAIYVQLILLVVAIVLSELLRPKPNLEDARPADIGDFNFTTATEGRPVPIIVGRVRLKGPNVLWYGDLFQEAVSETVKTGLWSKERFIKGYRYHLGVQMGLCRGGGEGVELLEAYNKGELAWSGSIVGEGRFDVDDTEFFGGEEHGSGGLQTTVDFYEGNKTQTVNAYLDDTARQRIATAATPTCPRYSGTCYVVLRELTSAAPTADDRGAYLGNSTTISEWEWEVRRFPGIFDGQAAGENKVGTDDANPVNWIVEILTDKEWGFGFNSAKIDLGFGSTFKAAADRMITEANGISMVIDRLLSAKELLNEVQRQIDGVVFFDRSQGKYRIQLVRAEDDADFGWDIDTVQQADDDSVLEVKEFTRGTREDTTNTIQVKFTKRVDAYKESYAIAQDMGGAIALAGGSALQPVATIGIVSYPGVKKAALASVLAWRDLRGQSYPLARADLVVDRTFWNVNMGEVIAFTNSALGFTKLPMRVLRIDLGKLTDGKILLKVIQDVFKFAAASMGDPPDSRWVPPTIGLVAFPSAQQVAFEAPRGIVVRDPDYNGDIEVGKVWCGARAQGSEVAFQMKQRNAPSSPGGSFADAGDTVSFMLIGSLDADLDAGTAIPTATVTINASPDSQTRLEAVFDDTSTLEDLGADLAQLIMVGDGANAEFMLVQKAVDGTGTDVDLQNVYRGVLGTAQQNHSALDPVYLIFVGGNLMDTAFNNTYDVDVELRMRSARAIFAGSVTTISLDLDKRALRPYPPSASRYNGSSSNFGTPDLEGDGSGLNGVGFDVDWIRRAFDTGDEVASLLADQAPSASTEYRVRVFVDPDSGGGTEIQGSPFAWVTGTGAQTPTQVAVVNEAIAGTKIRVEIEVRHDIFSEVELEGHHSLIHDVVPTSTRTSEFYLGGDLSAGVGSNSYTAAATGTFTVNIGVAFNSQVQYRINGGSWTNLTGYTPNVSTTGTIAGVITSDTIELRHQTNDTPALNFVEIQNPSATAVAYGVFTDGT